MRITKKDVLATLAILLVVVLAMPPLTPSRLVLAGLLIVDIGLLYKYHTRYKEAGNVRCALHRHEWGEPERLTDLEGNLLERRWTCRECDAEKARVFYP